MDLIPCFGVNCELHATCRAYNAIEFADPMSMRIGHCRIDENGRRTRYVPIHPITHTCVPQERRAA